MASDALQSEVTPRRVALTMLAHPDDAEILCGGTLVRLRDLGWDIHIATATSGDCGTMTHSARDISEIRTAEAINAASLVGGTFHCLGELDGRVCYNAGTIQKAFDLFRRINPSLVITHPRLDYMLDHEQVHLIARMASFLYAAPNVSDAVSVPPQARVPHLYYCDPIGGSDPYTGELVAASTVVDVSAAHTMKLSMLSCHASQREWLRSHHGMDEYLEATRRHDAVRGESIGVAFAEAFTQHRGHAYPQDDLLRQILRLTK